MDEEEVLRIELAQHVEDEPRPRLHLPSRALGARELLEDEPRDARDVAELPPREFAEVHRLEEVGGERLLREEPGREELLEGKRLGRDELDPVVVDRDREGRRPRAREPEREQHREPLMDEPPLEGVDEEMIAILGRAALDERLAGRGQRREPHLLLEDGPHERHLGAVEHAAPRPVERAPHRRRQRRRQREPRAVPARRRGGALRAADERRHVADAHELDDIAREEEGVARMKPRDERLLDRTEPPPADERHRDGRVCGDGADVEPVDLSGARAREPDGDDAVGIDLLAHAVVLLVARERAAARPREVEAPVEVGARERRERRRPPHLVEEFVRTEPATRRAGDDMLDEAVERRAPAVPLLDLARPDRIPRGGDLDELERVRRHAQHLAARARTVSGSPRALDEPRDPLRRTDLDHPLDRREVDAEIETRGRDDDADPPFLHAGLDALAVLALERAMVDRERVAPRGPLPAERREPPLGLRARVGEDEGRPRRVEPLDERIEHGQAEMPRPGETLDRIGKESGDRDLARDLRMDDRRRRTGAAEDPRRVVHVPERRRQAPCAHRGREPAQPRERELDLHAPLRRHEFVPLVDDDRANPGEQLRRPRIRQEKRERLGRRHEDVRQALALPRPFGRRRVARPRPDRDREPARLDRLAQRKLDVARERPERRQVDDREPVRRPRHEIGERPEVRRIGLAAPGRHMDEPALAAREALPALALEGVRRPPARGEPALGRPTLARQTLARQTLGGLLARLAPATASRTIGRPSRRARAIEIRITRRTHAHARRHADAPSGPLPRRAGRIRIAIGDALHEGAAIGFAPTARMGSRLRSSSHAEPMLDESRRTEIRRRGGEGSQAIPRGARVRLERDLRSPHEGAATSAPPDPCAPARRERRAPSVTARPQVHPAAPRPSPDLPNRAGPPHPTRSTARRTASAGRWRRRPRASSERW